MRLQQKDLTPVLSLPLSGLPPGRTKTSTAASSWAHTFARVTPYLAKPLRSLLCICSLPGKLAAVAIPPTPHSQISSVPASAAQVWWVPDSSSRVTGLWHALGKLDGLLKPISMILAQSPPEEWRHQEQQLALSQACHAVLLWATAHYGASNSPRGHQCPNSPWCQRTRPGPAGAQGPQAGPAWAKIRQGWSCWGHWGQGQATLGKLKRLYGAWKLSRGEGHSFMLLWRQALH